jgi:glycosyltransferase involved in cell wall biosynthesis
MKLSIIIPTYDEAENIARLIKHILENSNEAVVDVIVSDGGSTDDTVAIARHEGANAVVSPGKGRAAQMNYAASLATGDILYFIHADCFPPGTYVTDIANGINGGYHLGRYRTKFDSKSFILKVNAWFTRFDLLFAWAAIRPCLLSALFSTNVKALMRA